jgi:hypothetical protein
MMSDLPVVERVLQAVEARLAAIITVPGLDTDRNRQDPVEKDRMLVLQDGDQEHDEDQTIFVQSFRTIAIEGFVKVDAKADLGPALNVLWAEMVKALTGDVTLGGLAGDIKLGEYISNMAPTDDHRWTAEFSQKFTIHFTTAQGDPYSLAP